jgi:tellurite methyltransferase
VHARDDQQDRQDQQARDPSLEEEFGPIDIYLFDQLLRGRIVPGMRVFDAGCGGGRNLVYLLRHGYDVCGIDANPDAIASMRQLASILAPHLPAENFRAEPIEQHSFADASADVVLSSAVLHFARDDEAFAAMLQGSWRVAKPGGLFFCRLASRSGIEQDIHPLGRGRYLLPDGSERYLIDEPRLRQLTHDLGGTLTDPIKTTIVHGQRAMTTWVVRKR